MSLPFLAYARQCIEEIDIQCVVESLKGPIITRGAHVEAFERAIANYCGAKYAVAYNSGTAALMAAYFAAKVSSFDRVISTPNSFIATIGGAIRLGTYPRFIDIDRSTGNMDLNKLKKELDFHSTRGRLIVVPVHFAGIAVDMKQLDRLLYSHPNAVIIEDAAHAIGSTYPTGEKVGSCAWSQMTVFSFHAVKTITTGEGGMVTTNDSELYHRLQLYRNNGIEREAPYLENKSPSPGYYEVHDISGNFNLTDFQAALGRQQLERIESFIEKRRELMKVYRKKLRNTPHVRLLTDQFDKHTAFHLCVVQIDFEKYGTTKEKVMQELQANNIGTQMHYIPLYRHPVYLQKEDVIEQFPEMEAYYKQALSLPLYFALQESDVERVCKQLKLILKA